MLDNFSFIGYLKVVSNTLMELNWYSWLYTFWTRTPYGDPSPGENDPPASPCYDPCMYAGWPWYECDSGVDQLTQLGDFGLGSDNTIASWSADQAEAESVILALHKAINQNNMKDTVKTLCLTLSALIIKKKLV